MVQCIKNMRASYANMGETKSQLYEYYTKTGSRSYKKYESTHLKVFGATKDWTSTCVFAGNGAGKTFLLCYLHAVSLTGLYPTWWNGIRFRPGEPGLKGGYPEYNSVKTLFPTQELSTITDVLLPLLLGQGWRDNNRDPSYIGTGLIPRECFIPRSDGKGFVLEYGDGGKSPYHVYRFPVMHKNNTVSSITFKAYSQGAKSIVSQAFNLITPDEKAGGHYFSEASTRGTSRYSDARIVMAQTADKQENLESYIFDMLEEREKVLDITEEGVKKRLKLRKTIIISARQVPHMTESMIAKTEASADSNWLRKARIDGYPPVAQRQIVPAKDSELWLRDSTWVGNNKDDWDKGEIEDLKDEKIYKARLKKLEDEGWVPTYALDTGSSTSGFIIAYVYRDSMWQGQDFRCIITHCYNYHRPNKGFKAAGYHIPELMKALGTDANGNIPYCGIIDGSARSNFTTEHGEKFIETYARGMFDDKDSDKLRNVDKGRPLIRRVEFVNEMMRQGKIKVMYRDENMELMRQKNRWLFIRDANGVDKIKQDGGNWHLIKDCLMGLMQPEHLMWVWGRNKSIIAQRPNERQQGRMSNGEMIDIIRSACDSEYGGIPTGEFSDILGKQGNSKIAAIYAGIDKARGIS